MVEPARASAPAPTDRLYRPMITARRIARLRTLMLPSIRRHETPRGRLVITLYVRDSHGRTATLELAPANTVWWATERALISLGDARRADECRLVFRAAPLRPSRSLAACDIDHGDTLELVPVNAIGRRRTLAGALSVPVTPASRSRNAPDTRTQAPAMSGGSVYERRIKIRDRRLHPRSIVPRWPDLRPSVPDRLIR
jgi:hypothetical protein